MNFFPGGGTWLAWLCVQGRRRAARLQQGTAAILRGALGGKAAGNPLCRLQCSTAFLWLSLYLSQPQGLCSELSSLADARARC